MSRSHRLLIVLSVIVSLVLPATAAAGPPGVRAKGDMTSYEHSWSLYPSTYDPVDTPFRYRWQWTAAGRQNGTASGQLTLTVLYEEPSNRDYDKVVDRVRVPVTEAHRVSQGVVEFTVGGRAYTPGDPSWGSSLFRATDMASGDVLEQYCSQHEDFHVIAREGKASVK